MRKDNQQMSTLPLCRCWNSRMATIKMLQERIMSRLAANAKIESLSRETKDIETH